MPVRKIRLRPYMKEHSRQIDVEDPLPLGQVVILDGADVEDSGVVHQHVDAAELANRNGHRGLPLLGFGDVEVQVANGVAEPVRNRLALVVEDVAEHHLGPLGHQRAHVRGAHSPRAATDKRNLSR